MAKEILGKTVKELKQERTLAKGAFTKKANFLSRAETDKGGEADLNEQQQTELEKTFQEYEARLDEVRNIIQSNLWLRYGKYEVQSAIKEAKTNCDGVAQIPVTAVNRDGYELRWGGVKTKVQDAITSIAEWEMWIKEAEKEGLECRVKDLKAFSNNLEARRAEFLTAQRIEEDRSRGRVPQVPVPVPQPTLRIKPTCLPRFSRYKRTFHRWRRDWESLQKQGEPTGSVEVKKIQLLDSVDERICRDLRLSTYNTAEDMFRVLENRYGNKSTIDLEIIEDLEKIPALRANQPRKVIDMIQTIEKALDYLTELGNTGAINNPLVIKSIESKLPDSIKRDWLVFMVNPRNNVTSDNLFENLLTFLKTQEEILEKLEQLGVSEKPKKKCLYGKELCIHAVHNERRLCCLWR
ncbi:uncharacterized protein LOC115149571 [Tachysurus ichikawai]